MLLIFFLLLIYYYYFSSSIFDSTLVNWIQPLKEYFVKFYMKRDQEKYLTIVDINISQRQYRP